MQKLPIDPHCRFPDDFVWGVATSSFQIEGVPVGSATQRRTLKDSALWYRDFLQRQRQRREVPAPLAAEV